MLIIQGTGGRLIPDEFYERFMPYVGTDWIRCGISGRIGRIGGSFYTAGATIDSLDDCKRSCEHMREMLDKYTPPFLDSGHPAWIAPYDLGHAALVEVDFPREKIEETDIKAVGGILSDVIETGKIRKIPDYLLTTTPYNVIGDAFANVHLIAAKIKKSLDPKNIANPTRFINMEKMESLKDTMPFDDTQ